MRCGYRGASDSGRIYRMRHAAPASSPLDDTDAPLADPPTRKQLFAGFFMLGVTAFGGALPLAHRALVEKRRWLSNAEFTDLLGLCQFLPGGNIINMSVAIGMRFRGVSGALAALMGLILAPSLIVISLGAVYDRFQHDPHIQHFFAGLAAAAAGLLISMAIKITLPLRRKLPLMGIVVAGFVAIAILRWPLLTTMLVLTPLSVLVTWKSGL